MSCPTLISPTFAPTGWQPKTMNGNDILEASLNGSSVPAGAAVAFCQLSVTSSTVGAAVGPRDSSSGATYNPVRVQVAGVINDTLALCPIDSQNKIWIRNFSSSQVTVYLWVLGYA